MAEVLVLVKPAEGKVGKSTLEALTIARGLGEPSAVVVEASKRPPRQGGTRVTDEGEGGIKLVEYLATEKFV